LHPEDGSKLHRIVRNCTNLHDVITQKSSVFNTAVETLIKFETPCEDRPPDVAYGPQRIEAQKKTSKWME
jgi:hypothetical protein